MKKPGIRGEHRRIRLILRGDDMGMSPAANTAIELAFTKGILTCAAILAPAPWAEAAAVLARTHPEWCVGAHLALLGEWRGCRWRPVLPWNKVRSITDRNGFLRQTPKDFYRGRPDWREVEAELNAQVDLISKSWRVRLGYIDSHYLGGKNDPRLNRILKKIGGERRLPVSGMENEKTTQAGGIYTVPPGKKKAALLGEIRGMEDPGDYLIVFHPLLAGPESDALVHSEPGHVMKEGAGSHRVAELNCLLDPEIRKLIGRQGIKLIDYRELGK